MHMKQVNNVKLKTTKEPKDKLLARLTLFFFDRPRTTALVWLILATFGILSYTTFLSREGFPSVNIPVAIVTGTYVVNDPAKVDSDLAKPISTAALKQKGVSSVQAQSLANFFSVSVQYKEGVDAHQAVKTLQKDIESRDMLPKSAIVAYDVPYFGVTGGDTKKIDLTISLFRKDDGDSTADLTTKAQQAADWLNAQHLSLVQSVFIQNPYAKAIDQATGQPTTVQRSFDRFGMRQDNVSSFYNSGIIAVTAKDGADAIKLDDQVRGALATFNAQPQFTRYHAEVSASYASSIKDSISELQRVLLEGLIAVLVVGSIVIAIRASIITVLSMLTVLLLTSGLLYLIGYSLNVITLFALLLSLSLIVDDTIIMVEAIDAARRRQKDARHVVGHATRKVSRAMVAATLTAVLSFAPLIFVSGVLGGFIRAIPITIISALLISLLSALVLIPFFARFLLLGKKQLGDKGVHEVAAGFEAALARGIGRPMLWAKGSIKRLFAVGSIALVIGLGFIVAAGFIAKGVVFNIFPPTKDTNGLILTFNYPPDTTVQQAQAIANDADTLVGQQLGSNFVQASYYESGTAQGSGLSVTIISYEKRDVTSPQLVKQLQTTFDKQFREAKVKVGQQDVGPPNNPFVIKLVAEDREAAFRTANSLATFLESTTLTRPSGKTAHFTNVTVMDPGVYTRADGKQNVQVSADFDGTDTSTLVTLAQTAVKDEYTAQKLSSYGLASSALQFDIGQESENQNSFKSLALAFPILLAVIYILLAVQFRSLLQPLLIFMALPFSLFGVMLGLRISNNPISFFAMLGFFALIGLSIKNTILLVDFANQSRQAGMRPVDAAVAALSERFRPLAATSVTAVVSLIPLAITSPFWQGLAVVLIFGLLSSTLLVITVFPYYYLGAEYLRQRVGRAQGVSWVLLSIAITVPLIKLVGGFASLIGVVAATVIVKLVSVFARKKRAA